jgi:gp32 DNA binding protein like
MIYVDKKKYTEIYMTDITRLKNMTDISKLQKEIEKMNSATEYKQDDRIWYPEVDKAGNGMAIIRFLPAPAVDGEDSLPWVRLFRHSFKGPTGKWYIENSLTTIGQKDPVSEYNSELWNKTNDDKSPERKQARDQKRKLEYMSNVLIIKDSANPENEGKIKLYRYGKKIFDKIMEAMKPQFEDEQAMNPFDAWKGANFKLKIRTVDEYRNYDKSEFDAPSVLGTDEEIDNIWNAEFSLKEFVAPDKFKTYDELKRKLYDVLELGGSGSTTTSVKAAAAKPSKAAAKVLDDDVPFDVDDDIDEDLSKFLNDE